MPLLAICKSKKRGEHEKYKIHKDCAVTDECTPCTFTSESVVQAYWRLQLFPLLQPHMRSATLVARHAHASLPPSFYTNALAPDIVLYRSTMPLIDFYIISVGELKHSDNIEGKHCGQLAKYAQVLFELHPHRQRIYAWLATQNTIRLFKFEADDHCKLSSVETSQDYSYEEGLQHLCSMLRLDLPDLGVFADPIPMPGSPGDGLVPIRYLGRGSFATAYAAAKPTGDGFLVIKLFRVGASGACALQCEQQTLLHLAEHNIKGVTTLVGSAAYPSRLEAAEPTALVLEPEGVTLERVVRNKQRTTKYRLTRMLPLYNHNLEIFADDALCKLLDIVRDVHVIGDVVHCDLSLDNMYFLPNGEVRTN